MLLALRNVRTQNRGPRLLETCHFRYTLEGFCKELIDNDTYGLASHLQGAQTRARAHRLLNHTAPLQGLAPGERSCTQASQRHLGAPQAGAALRPSNIKVKSEPKLGNKEGPVKGVLIRSLEKHWKGCATWKWKPGAGDIVLVPCPRARPFPVGAESGESPSGGEGGSEAGRSAPVSTSWFPGLPLSAISSVCFQLPCDS